METRSFPAMLMPSRCGWAHRARTRGALQRSSAICLLAALFSCIARKPGHQQGQVIPAWLSGFIVVLQGLGGAAAALPWQVSAEQSLLCGSLMPGERVFLQAEIIQIIGTCHACVEQESRCRQGLVK